MILLFWALAAGLTALAVAAVAVPLLRGRTGGPSLQRVTAEVFHARQAELEAELQAGQLTPEQYELARTELARSFLEEAPAGDPARPRGSGRWALPVVALAVPLLAVGLYLQIGAAGPGLQAGPGQGMRTSANGMPADHQFDELVAGLRARLEADPSDAQGWVLLARTYYELERYAEAAQAFAQASALMPEDAGILVDYADALAAAHGRRLSGAPAALVERALALDPNHVKGLWLAGTAAFQSEDYPRALQYWERLRAQVPDGSRLAQVIDANLDSVRERLGLPVLATAADASAAEAPAEDPAPASISGTVALAPALAGKVAPGDTVFVFARAAEGPPMPLAVVRRPARDLPFEFTLDDSMAMTPQARLSNHAEVLVAARISKAGSVTPRAGDLEARPVVARVGASGPISILIDQEVLP